jgi:hypothetical protein
MNQDQRRALKISSCVSLRTYLAFLQTKYPLRADLVKEFKDYVFSKHHASGHWPKPTEIVKDFMRMVIANAE